MPFFLAASHNHRHTFCSNKEDPQNRDRHTKGGRTNAPASRDGKRQYDRKSGTGRGKEIKKGGGGGHNWGSDKQDAKNAEGPVTEGKEEANVPEEDPTADAEEDPEKTPTAEQPEPEPEPEVDNTISYEEYLAQKARPDSAAFQPVQERQLDVNEFASKAARSKKETEKQEFMQMGEGKKMRKKGTGKKEKKTLALDFRSPGRGGRGGGEYGQDGRGGGRGGRGYGSGRGGRGGGYEGGRGGRGGGYEGGRGGRGGGYEGGRGGRGGRHEGGRGRGGERREGGRSGRGSTGGGRGSSGGGSKPLDTADVSAFPSL